MVFFKINPTLADIAVPVSTFGSAGDIMKVTLVGDFRASVPTGAPSLPEHYDTWKNTVIEYMGVTSDFYTPAYGVIATGATAHLINRDRPLNDNDDPDNDYGVNVTKVTLSMATMPSTVFVTEGEAGPKFTFTLSEALPFDIWITTKISDPGYENDLVARNFRIPAGQTSISVAAVNALKDEALEQRELGRVTFSASADGYPVAFTYKGNRVTSTGIDLEVEDRVVKGLEQKAEQIGYDWASKVVKYCQDTWDVGFAVDAAGASAKFLAWTRGVTAVAGVAIDTSQIAHGLSLRLESAGQLAESARANAVYDALRTAYAEVWDAVFKTAITAGGAAAGAGAAAFTLGAVKLITGVALTGAAAAALPAVAIVGAGWASLILYESYISPIVKQRAATVFSDDVPRSTFIEKYNSLPELPDLSGTTTGNDTVAGTSGSESISGKAGNDTIDSKGGSDLVHGNEGNDIMIASLGSSGFFGDAGNDMFKLSGGEHLLDGGDGLDILSLAGATSAANVDLAAGSAYGAKFTALLDSVERVIGSRFGDTLRGDAAANALWGEAGDDLLDGRGGVDKLYGGLGNDTYVLGADNDSVEDTGGANDTVTSTISRSLAAYAGIETLKLLGTANINATGDAAANILVGNAGNNILDGAAGADKLYGGAGNDTYVLGAESDLVSDSAGTADIITTTITRSLANYTGIERLYLLGTANISGTGDNLANTLLGNAGRNTLNGQGGNDVLQGNAGADILTGGVGNDYFVFANATDSNASGYDTITDFKDNGADRIKLSDVYAGTLGFLGVAGAFTAANQVRLVQVGTSVNVAINLDANNSTYEMLIRLAGTATSQLTSADFLL